MPSMPPNLPELKRHLARRRAKPMIHKTQPPAHGPRMQRRVERRRVDHEHDDAFRREGPDEDLVGRTERQRSTPEHDREEREPSPSETAG